MVRPTKGRSAGFDVILDFEVLPEDSFGNLRVDIEDDCENEIAIFPGAIENFQGTFAVNLGDDPRPPEFDFQFDSVSIGRGQEAITDVGIPDPITLDLVARKSETEFIGTVYPSIEYSFIGGGLTAFGIYETSIILLDADANDTNGFQVVLDSNDNSILDSDLNELGFQFSGAGGTRTINLEPDEDSDTISPDEQIVAEEGLTIFEIDPIAAVNDIRYITGEDDRLPVSPLLLADVSRVSGPSASDPTVIVNNIGSFVDQGENLLIEAEDLNDFNLIGNVYREETIGSGEDSFEVISLRDSSNFGARDVSGEVRLIVGSDQVDISGNYNLTISTFDENDGKGTIEVLVNGESKGVEELLDISENPTAPNNYPNEDIRQEFTFSLGQIEAGNEIIIQGTSNGEEFVRIDFITLERNLII